uniref:Uncharacterized protein n=1 Tax=Amphimedon queenslandica TaxID=400682 RepID=A0A1X7V456_AMPQE
MEEPIGSWVFPRLSLTLASKEMVYFSKWIYRHRNRLRKDKSFQRLLQIERLIKRYLKINITSLAKQALKEINSSGRIVSSTQLISFMTQLSDCTLYVIQLLKLMESTFNDLYQRIETCHLLYAYIIAKKVLYSEAVLCHFSSLSLRSIATQRNNMAELYGQILRSETQSIKARKKRKFIRESKSRLCGYK